MTGPLDQISEKEWQATVIEAAKACGWKHYHTYRSQRSVAGFPDLILIRGRELIVVEIKRQHGKVSKPQQEWLSLFEGAGVPTFVWRPSHWEQIQSILGEGAVEARLEEEI